MKLMKLPYVALKEVLDHLTLNSIFFLSLCSKRTKNFIKQTQKYQLEKIEHLIYSIDNRMLHINVKMSYKDFYTGVLAMYQTEADFVRLSVREASDSIEAVQGNGLGITIDFFRSPNHPYDQNLLVKYGSGDLESIFNRIHNHLYDLLGNHIKIYVRSYQQTDFLPPLPNIHVLEVRGDEYNSTRVEELVARSTCLEYFSWTTVTVRNIELRENSHTFDLDTVLLTAGSSAVRGFMKHFNGRHAFLRGYQTILTTADFIQFLNSWISGEKFRNLEVISADIRFERPRILDTGELIGILDPIAEIHGSVEFKRFNKEVVYSIREFKELRLRIPREFRSHWYIVRKSDGHVASVMLTRWKLFLGVWNMTEKEFVEKFQ